MKNERNHPKPITEDEIEKRFGRVRALIHCLSSANRRRFAHAGDRIGHFFAIPPLGHIHIHDPNEIELYEKTLHSLETMSELYGTSRETTQNHLHEAMLMAIDPRHLRTDTSLEDRISEAISRLKDRLLTETTEWLLAAPVSGCQPINLPPQFGFVTFVRQEDVAHIMTMQSDMQSRYESASANTKVIGIATVRASDSSFARAKGIEALEEAADIINFYNDTFEEHRHGPLTLGTAHGGKLLWSVAAGRLNDSPHVSISRLAPKSGDLAFPTQSDPAANETGYWKFSDMITNKEQNTLQRKILTSARIAGRASAERTTHAALLGHIIALEQLLVEEDFGVADKTATRAAHLLGADVESRRDILGTVRDLYTLRSKIAHEGLTEVSQSSTDQAADIARASIRTIALCKPFICMTDKEELKHWFNRKILETETPSDFFY